MMEPTAFDPAALLEELVAFLCREADGTWRIGRLLNAHSHPVGDLA